MTEYEKWKKSQENNSKMSEYEAWKMRKENPTYELDSDTLSLNKTINKSLSGWQDSNTMSKTRNEVSSMLTRLDSVKSYLKKNNYNDKEYSDNLDELIATYKTALSSIDDHSKYYSQYKNADAYNKAYKTSQIASKYEGKSYADMLKNYDKADKDERNWIDQNKYQYMNTKELEAEKSKLEAEKDAFKKENGGKLRNNFAKLGAYINAGNFSEDIVNQNRADAQSNIDKLDEYDHKLEMVNQYITNRNIQDKVEKLDDNSLKLIDEYNDSKNTSKASYLDQIGQALSGAGGYSETNSQIQSQSMGKKNEALIALQNTINPVTGKKFTADEVQEYAELRQVQKDMEDQADRDADAKKLAEEHAISSVLLARASNFVGGFTGTAEMGYQTLEKLAGERQNYNTYDAMFAPTRATQTIDQTNMEDMGIIGKGAYRVATSMADNALRAIYASAVGGIAGDLGMSVEAVDKIKGITSGALMSSQIMPQAIIEGKEKGYSDGKALATATVQAIIEGVTEAVSMEQILKPQNSKNILTHIIKSFVAEGSEEVASNVLNRIYDDLANGQYSEFNQLIEQYKEQGYDDKQALVQTIMDVAGDDLEAFLIGGLSGAGMGGGTYALNSGINAINNKAETQSLANELTDVNSYGNAYRLAQISVDNDLAQQYSQAFETVKNNEDIAKAKLDNGKLTKGNFAETSEGKQQVKQLNKTAYKVAKQMRKNVSSELKETRAKATTDYLRENGATEEQIKAVEEFVNGKGFNNKEARAFESIDEKLLTDAIASGEKALNVEYSQKMVSAIKASGAKEKIQTDDYKINNEQEAPVMYNGEAQGIKKFDSIADGKVTLDNGETVDVADLDLTKDSAIIIEGIRDYANRYNIAEDDASILLDVASGIIGTQADTENTMYAINDALRLGAIGIEGGDKALMNSNFIKSVAKVKEAYNAVQKAYDISYKASVIANEQRESEKDFSKVVKSEGNLGYDKSVTSMDNYTREQKAESFVLKQLVKNGVISNRIVLFDSQTTTDENLKNKNGKFVTKEGTIWIDIHAEQGILGALSHELTHMIKQFDNATYKQLGKILFEGYGDLYNKYGAESIEDVIKFYQAKNNNSDSDLAYEEFVADMMTEMLSSTNAIETIAKLRGTMNEKAQNKFIATIKKVLNALKDYFGNKRAKGYSNLLTQMNNLQNIVDVWSQGVANAMNVVDANGYVAEDYSGIPSIETTKGIVDDGSELNSNKTFNTPLEKFIMPLGGGKVKVFNKGEQYTTLQILEQIAGKNKNGQSKLKDMKKALNEMSKFMEDAVVKYQFIGLEDVNNASISYDAETGRYIFSAMVKNGEYPVNFDFTTICKKRDSASRFVDDILTKTDENGNKISQTYRLTQKNLVLLNDALRENGYETAYLGCFVEAKRFNIDTWASTIVDEWNTSVRAYNPNAEYLIEDGKDASTSNVVMELTSEQIEELDQELKDNTNAKQKEKWRENLRKATDNVKVKENDLQLAKEALDKANENYANATDDKKSAMLKKVNTANKNYIKAVSDLDKAIEKRDKIASNPNQKSSITPAEKADALIKTKAEYQKLIKVSDLVTKEGIREIARDYPELMTFIKTRYGTATPKLTQGFTPYNSEIALLPDKKGKSQSLVDYLYSIAGMRGQSFSDFKIEYVFDYLQLFADAGMRDLPMHFYTKEISFAQLFGRMGAKINLSVMYNIMNEDYWADHMDELKAIGETETDLNAIAKKYVGLYFEDGKLTPLVADKKHSEIEANKKYFNGAIPQQSVDYEEALKLQMQEGYSGDVGTIGVGYGDMHIRMLLRDNNIRYVIPYHSSSLPIEVKEMTHIDFATDYTSTQNTLKISKMLQNGEEITFGMWLKNHGYKQFNANNSIQVINQLNKEIADGTVKVSTAKAKAGHGDFNLYTGKYGIQNTKNPKKTVAYYVADCLEKGYLPVFYQFADEENYYKVHFDFNVYDNVNTEQYAPQGGVHFDVGNIEEFKSNVSKYMSELNAYNEVQYTPEKMAKTEADWMRMVDEDNANKYSTKEHKQAQYELIQKTNPKDESINKYATWIDKPSDVRTFREALEEDGGYWDGVAPDFTADDIQKALKSGYVTVYSTYPIKNGVFVSPSRMEAESYGVRDKIHSKRVALTDVAWIDAGQGQYAKVDDAKFSTKDSEGKGESANVDENSLKGNSSTQELENKKITIGMSDSERADILKSKSLYVETYSNQSNKFMAENEDAINSKSKTLFRDALNRISKEFNVFGSKIVNADTEIEVSFSKGTISETVNKNMSIKEIVKLFPIIKTSVENAVALEEHNNRYYYDNSTTSFYSLLGGYIDGEYFVPIRFGVKLSAQSNKLYVIVSQDKIKKDKVIVTQSSNKLSPYETRLSKLSISNIIENVNNKDILRYAPDEMINNSQKKIKYEAIAETIKKTNDKNDKKYFEFVKNGDMASANSMVKAKAKDKGYTLKVYHGTSNTFDEFIKKLRGSNTKTKISENWFFASDQETANSYYPYGIMKELEKQNPRLFSPEKLKNKGNLYELYLKLENPLVVDVSNYDYDVHRDNKDAWVEFGEKAIKNGNDGIILLNAMDNQLKTKERKSTVYMFENPNQVKSADTIVYDENGNIIPLSERFDEHNNKFKYSTKETPRDILLSTFSGLAQNDIEQKYLDDYRKNITELNNVEKQLKNTREELKELSFSKGKRDKERIASLRNTATRLENQLTVYDKKLIRLESAKPIKDILDRQKRDAQQYTKQKIAEVRKAEREKSKERLDTLVSDYQQKRKKAIQKRKNTAIRTEIKKVIHELGNTLNKPTKGHYVPQELVNPVAEVLSAINIDSGRSEKLSEKLALLKVKYDEIAQDSKYSIYHNDVISEMINSVVKETGDTSIYDMNNTQLNAVLNLLKGINHTVKNAVKVKNAETELDAFQFAQQLIKETDSIDKRQDKLGDKYINAMLRPETMFNRLGNFHKNSYWNKLYNILNEGQLKQTQLMMEGQLIFAELFDDKQLESLSDRKNLVDIGLKDADGNSVKVTRGMMLSIYMALMNEQNAKHIQMGGYTVPALKDYYHGKTADAFGAGSIRTSSFGAEIAEITNKINGLKRELKVTEDIERQTEIEDEIDNLKEQRSAIYADAENYGFSLLKNIQREMTDFDRQVVQLADKFFNEWSKNQLNKTTLEEYGFEKANVEKYYPINTDKNFLSASFEQITKDMSLENVGFMKERINGANPILLEDITDVINRQIKNVAQYSGMMPAVAQFNRIYGKTTSGYASSVQDSINKKFGKNGKDYIANLMSDIVGSRQSQSTFFDTLRGAMAGATLSLNPRVALAQTASYPTAMAELGAKPLAKALAKGGKGNAPLSRADKELIMKYSPLLYHRMQGFSTQEIGDAKTMRMAKNQVMDKMKWAMGWINAFDGATVGRLWYASQYYVDEHNPKLQKGTDAYYEEVAKVFNKVVERTQPNYTTLQRPDVLRNPNAVVKQLTMFMTQRLQNFNILYDSVQTLKTAKADRLSATEIKEAKNNVTRAITSQLIASAMIVGMKALVDFLLHSVNSYRDDDEDLTAESVSLTLLNNFAETLVSNVIAGSELYDIATSVATGDRYYGISLNGVDSFTDAIEKFVKTAQMTANGELDGDSVLDLAKSVSQLMGIPLANAMKIVNAVIYHAEDIGNGEFLSYEAGVERTNKQNINRYTTTGDSSIIDEMVDSKIESGKTEKEAKSAVRSSMTSYYKPMYLDAYNKNNSVEMARIRKLMYESGVYGSANDVVKTCQKWIKDSKK